MFLVYRFRDIATFIYDVSMRLPVTWKKSVGFNKTVPRRADSSYMRSPIHV